MTHLLLAAALTFRAAVALCTAQVRDQIPDPSFDTFVSDDGWHVTMFATRWENFQFDKCMQAHGHELTSGHEAGTTDDPLAE